MQRVPYRLVCIDKGDNVPDEPGDAAGLVFMGGSMSANDSYEWIAQELTLIKSALSRGIPVLGHCLGGQLIAKALGAEITMNPVREIGWHDVEKLPGRISDEWLGESMTFPTTAFHWHGETFSIPDGAVPILRSQFCENQAFVFKNTLAMQCHIEMTEEQVNQWSVLYEDQIAVSEKSIQSKDEMLNNLAPRIDTLRKLATCVYSRWLQGVMNYTGDKSVTAGD